MAGPLRLRPFDVVVVPFPYSDSLAEKRRPAVVVSVPEVERAHGWLWLAMITSSPGPPKHGDVSISDLGAAGLNVACRVRCAKLATLDGARIVRRAGALSKTDATAVAFALRRCLAG